MAIKLKDTYAGRVDTNDPAYPYGKGRNIVGGVEGTGTPFEADWYNNLEGFLQGLLVEAGITPDESVDTADSSQLVEAVKGLEKSADKVINDDGSTAQDTYESSTVGVWGDRFKGTFQGGFAYEDGFDVGLGQDGRFYKYIGSDPYPVTVAAGTIASDFDLIYQNVEVTNHNGLTDRNAVGAHDQIYSRSVKDIDELKNLDVSYISIGNRFLLREYYSNTNYGSSTWQCVSGKESNGTFILQSSIDPEIQFELVDKQNATGYGMDGTGFNNSDAALLSYSNETRFINLEVGNFKLNNKFTLSSDQIFKGVGDVFGSTVIWKEVNTTVFDTVDRVTRLTVDGIRIVYLDDDELIYNNPNQWGMLFETGYMVELKDITFGDHSRGYSKGILISNGNCFDLRNIRMLRGAVSGDKTAIEFNSCQDVNLSNCQFERDFNSKQGSYVRPINAQDINIGNCHFEYSGIIAQNSRDISVKDTAFASSAMFLDDGCLRANIENVGGGGYSNILMLGTGTIKSCPFGNISADIEEISFNQDDSVVNIGVSYANVISSSNDYGRWYGEDSKIYIARSCVINKTRTPINDVSIRYLEKNSPSSVIKETDTFTVGGDNLSTSIGTNPAKNGVVRWDSFSTPAGSGGFITRAVSDGSSNTESDVTIDSVVYECINYNADFSLGLSGWESASATATTPRVGLANVSTSINANGRLVLQPSSTSWQIQTQFLAKPGKTCCLLIKGNWSDTSLQARLSSIINSTEVNNYLSTKWYDEYVEVGGKKYMQLFFRTNFNQRVNDIIIGAIGHDQSSIELDYVAVFYID